MNNQERRYRLRPSVSLIPTRDTMIWEFFQSNTRRIRHIKVNDNTLIEIIKNLNGNSISEIVAKYGLNLIIDNFIYYLYDSCIIEDSEIAKTINSSPFNRVINFLADYFPSHEVLEKFKTLQDSNVLIVGVGAVGSWIAILLAQTGISTFTLCDPDVVKPGNLNRSLFFYEDIGCTKVSCIERTLLKINPKIEVNCIKSLVQNEFGFMKIVNESPREYDLVINASDFPNVDTTSEIISKVCMEKGMPHIIAGGYNLHLSLIGPTIIPKKTPCFQCIKLGLENEKPQDFTRLRKMYRINRNIGNLSPLAGISASFVSYEAVRVLVSSDKMPPVMAGRRGEFNFLTAKLNFSEYPMHPKCQWCGNR